MTYWVSTHGYEFSTHVYTLLNKFVENTFIRDGHVHIAESLQSEIAKAFHGRNVRRAAPPVRAQMSQPDPTWGVWGGPTGTSVGGSLSVGGGSSREGGGGGSGALSSTAHAASVSGGSGATGASVAAGVSSGSGSSAFSGSANKPFGNCPEPKLPKTIFDLSLTLDDVDEEEIARQLTCLDSETFNMMKTRELIKNAWLKNRGKKAKRLVLLLNAANALTKWVIDTITVSTTQPASFLSSIASAQSLGANFNFQSPSVASSASSTSLSSHSTTISSSLNTSSHISLPGAAPNAAFGPNAISPHHVLVLLSKSAKANLSAASVLTTTAIKRISKLLARWLRIAEHLKALNNFHSLLAIWTALRSRYGSALFELMKKELPKHAIDVRCLQGENQKK